MNVKQNFQPQRTWFDKLTMIGPHAVPLVLSLSKDVISVANRFQEQKEPS